MIKESIKEVKMSDETLITAMTSLVKVLRELLANMEEEQKALLEQNASGFQQIMNSRDILIRAMHESQNVMGKELDLLSALHPEFPELESEKEKLMNLAKLAGEEHVELLTLRDQILALMEKMEKQNASNNHLLGNRATESSLGKENYNHQFKPVKRRIHPKKGLTQQKKILVKTLEIASENT